MTSNNSLLGIQRCSCAILVFFLILAPGIGWGQASAPAATPASLTPAAQEAVNQGLNAAKVPDYLLAIRYFQDALKLAPDSPPIFFYLGVAESKVPGRELRAIAWFGAYLAANPAAPNAAAVKKQMDELVLKSQSDLLRLIKSLQDAASGYDHLRDVAGLWAAAGDIASAIKTADLIPEGSEKGSAHQYIAEAQVKSGDIAGAVKTADLIQENFYKGIAQSAIAQAQAKRGDIAGAQKTVALIKDDGNNAGLLKHWYIRLAQEAIARARSARESTSDTQRPIFPVMEKVYFYQWLACVDGEFSSLSLNREPFLDWAGYLKSLPRSVTPQKLFKSLHETAVIIVKMQDEITGMLKQQAVESAYSNAMRIEPEAAFYYARGIERQDKGDFKGAKADYKMTLEILPGHAGAIIGLEELNKK